MGRTFVSVVLRRAVARAVPNAGGGLARRAQKLAPERGVSDEEKVLQRFSSSFYQTRRTAKSALL